MTLAWSDRLDTLRAQQLVGRDTELDDLVARLHSASPTLCWVHGPGGIGKTALLDGLARRGRVAGVRVARLDASRVPASRSEIRRALRTALADDPTRATWLLVDAVDAWADHARDLRDDLLPELPASARIVFASRDRPSLAWRSHSGWGACLHDLPLRQLSREATLAYARSRGLPAPAADALWTHTLGFPLAAVLAADAWQRGDSPDAWAASDRDALVRRLVGEPPSPSHADALAVAAIARDTTLPLLRSVLASADVDHEFAWLRSLSIHQDTPHGLSMQDLAREVIVADLQARDEPHLHRIMDAIRQHTLTALSAPRTRRSDTASLRAMHELTWLYRHHRWLRPFFAWTAGSPTPRPAAPADRGWILDHVRRFEGADAAALADHWLTAQPETAVLFERQGERIGFYHPLHLSRRDTAAIDADPVTAAWWSHLERTGPLRDTEHASLVRTWFDAEVHQSMSEVQSAAWMRDVVRFATAPHLAVSAAVFVDIDLWRPVFAFMDWHGVPDAACRVGDATVGVLEHDWRRRPFSAWAHAMGTRQLDADARMASPRELPARLERAAFDAAIKTALVQACTPQRLQDHPLTRSALVASVEPAARAAALLARLIDAVERLDDVPASRKAARAVHRTYLCGATTQEKAAERLGMAFSTYRRHLARGIAEVAEDLWQQDLAA